MKKLLIFIGLLVFLCGCGNNKNKDIVNDLSKKIESTKSYHLTGTLEIYRNEEKYLYDINSSYKKDDFYKVDLINKNNNHEQIILRNKDGVYVITPSLNKNFKFQSDWPNNNSQIYLLQPVINDIKSDNERTIKETKKGYVITSKVNYSSEKDFVKQKVYLDKEKNITKIEVIDKNDIVKMCLKIIDIDYKARFENKYFDSSNYQSDSKKENNEDKTSKIEDIVYPTYMPANTELSSEDIVETKDGERVILTFGGDSNFTLIQEVCDEDKLTNFVYGEPYLILDTVGSITDSSVSWISNGIEYSVMSNNMTKEELLSVAESLTVNVISK